MRKISKEVRGGLPAGKNELKGSKSGEGFETLGKVVGVKESVEMTL